VRRTDQATGTAADHGEPKRRPSILITGLRSLAPPGTEVGKGRCEGPLSKSFSMALMVDEGKRWRASS